LIQDEFMVADANPLVDPRIAEPGPGVWDVTDLDARLSVAGGALTIVNPASASWDRTMLLLSVPFSRRRGRFLEGQFTPTANNQDQIIGWQKSESALINAHEAGIRFGGGGFVLVADGTEYVNPLWPYTGGTSYAFRVYDGGAEQGDFYYYVRATSTTTWTLIWRKRSSASFLTQLWVALNNIGHDGTMSYLRVRNGVIKNVAGFVTHPSTNQDLCGAADGIHEVQVECPASGSPGLVFRKSSSNNLWKLVLNRAGNTLDLIERNAGVDTTRATTAFTWVTGDTYLLRAVTFGDYIRCFLGRTAGPTYTSSFNNTADLTGTLADATYTDLRVDTGGELQW
jgi:hypothetical protein